MMFARRTYAAMCVQGAGEADTFPDLRCPIFSSPASTQHAKMWFKYLLSLI